MNFNSTNISCGVVEIHDLEGSTLRDLCRTLDEGFNWNKAFVLWSDIVGSGEEYGQALADEINREFPGTVLTTPGRINPNTGNNIAVYTWMIPHNAVRAWYATTSPKPLRLYW